MPAVDFNGGYAGVQLRKAVFDRLHPHATTEHETVAIEEAFPRGHWEGEGKPMEAIVFTIFANDGLGTFWQGIKEIDTMEKPKGGSWRARVQTAEAFVTDRTKAMGRCLTDAGIPMKLPELRLLMSWITELEGRPSTLGRRQATYSGDATPDDIDSPDAGGDDGEKTLEQIVAEKVMGMDGPTKARLSRRARTDLGIGNLYQSGDLAPDLLKLIGELADEPEES